ncbi:hypothetical protein FRC04_005041 [Tulasnella sp. 424]|nr:hypothetical protein FRC04_005041 [Tulasnella sp. 424]
MLHGERRDNTARSGTHALSRPLKVTYRSQVVEFFKGTGREECEIFVRSIRAAAWREDKDDDDRWMANYASLRFAGQALNWHSRLPPDIRRDWSKLEMALLNQWPSLNDDVDDNSAQ